MFSAKWYLVFALAFFINFSPNTASAHEGEHTIGITKDSFSPDQLEIDKGDTVIFVNTDIKEHWPASNIHPTHEIYSEFDPKKGIPVGESWSFTFEKAGTWQFHDHLYPTMVGKIVVRGEETLQPEPAKPSFKEVLGNTFEKFKIAVLKKYYRLFPKKLEKKLLDTNIHKAAQDDKTLSYWLKILGPGSFMTELLIDSGGGSIIDCHQEAHRSGRMAYEVFGPSVWAEGDSSCHSGFYHGAMEAFLKQNGTKHLAEDITEICNTFKTQFGNFECLHGVGHGVMAYLSYDLPQAIETCKLLENAYSRESCMGGVFMENIIVAEGQGAIPGHETQWLSSDPHYPCNLYIDSPDIQTQCYLIQTARMLDLLNYDFSRVSAECEKAPENMRETCFQSLGRDAAGKVLRDPVKILEICEEVPQMYFDKCIEGSLFVILEFWGERMTDQPHRLCRLITEPQSKEKCYQKLSGRLWDIFGQNTTKIQEICSYYEPQYRVSCQ